MIQKDASAVPIRKAAYIDNKRPLHLIVLLSIDTDDFVSALNEY